MQRRAIEVDVSVDDRVVAPDILTDELKSARVVAVLEDGRLELIFKDSHNCEESDWCLTSFNGKRANVARDVVSLESGNVLCRVSLTPSISYSYLIMNDPPQMDD